MKDTKQINEYSFHEFLAVFQEAVLEGYRLDLDSNDLFPQKFGDHLYVGMVKESVPVEVPVEDNTEVPEVTPKRKTK